jgi:hypothetical protein
MERSEINNFIEKLKKSNLDKNAYLGIFSENDYSEESYVKANKAGLELLAAKILQASIDFDGYVGNSQNFNLGVNNSEAWFDENSHFLINYVKPVEGKEKIEDEKEVQKKWYEDLISAGCILVAIFLVSACLLGVYTIIKWLF